MDASTACVDCRRLANAATIPGTWACHLRFGALPEAAIHRLTGSIELGNPQKIGPCGGNPNGDNDEILSGVVTEVTGGSRLHLKIQETIFHSGHYRVALSVNSRNELPADPLAFEKYTDRGIYSVWGVIQSPPQIPVLADGLFRHYLERRLATGGTRDPPVVTANRETRSGAVEVDAARFFTCPGDLSSPAAS